MSFDWGEYERLAKDLRNNGDEASQRTAISRLYYSIYHQALHALEKNDSTFLYSKDKPAHQQVWDAYLKSRTLSSIGNKGKQLRYNREKADYHPQIIKLDQVLEESFQTAKTILAYLNQIQ